MERHTETRPEGRGWACIGMGLVWLWEGVYRTIWRPGIGSFTSWLGLTVVIVSCLCMALTLWLLKSIPRADRNRRRNVSLTLLSVYLVAGVVFLTLGIVKRTDALRDFYFYSASTSLGVLNIFMGLDLFLENPRGQNPGWLYFMVGLYALTWGLLNSLLLREKGLSWTGMGVACAIGLYLLAVSLILRFSSDLYRGRRRGCGNLMALLAYKTFGMLLLAFYFCVTLVFFGLSFAATTPETSRFCLYTGWMLLGAGAVWLGVSRIRHWDWI